MLEGKILLVEDSEESRFLIEKLLCHIGYKKENIISVATLADLSKVKAKALELIITDLSLPDSRCDKTFPAVQKKFPYTPIIVLSGAEEEAAALTTIQQGAQDYLTKGEIDSRILSRSIRYAIERKKGINDYMRLFEENPAPMYIYERGSYSFLAVNHAAIKQYKYSREEFLTITAKEIRPLEEVDHFDKANKGRFAGYNDFGRWRHNRKNGETFHVRIYGHDTEFEGRKARMVLALDIDAKVKAENALHDKTEQLTNVMESITDSFFAFNKNWEFTYVNKQCEKVIGAGRNELLGKVIWDAFPHGKEMKYYHHYQHVLKQQVSVHFEEYDPLFDKWFSVNAYPLKDEVAVYFRDVTEQKKIQEKIQKSEQNLRAIINNTQDIIWSVDTNNNIISANDAFWKRVNELAGKKIHTLSREDFDDGLFHKWQDYFQKALAGRAYKIIWKETWNGKEIFEEVSFNPILDKNNNAIGVSCFSRDITEQHVHLAMIENQNKQLKKIAWTQSHEIRRPIANILGLLSILNKEDIKDTENMSVIDLIESSTLELDKIVRKITDYSRFSGN
jgi:PAS domain S-box-containing protein